MIINYQNHKLGVQNLKFSNLEFRISNHKFRIQNLEFRLQNNKFRTWNDLELRIQNLEFIGLDASVIIYDHPNYSDLDGLYIYIYIHTMCAAFPIFSGARGVAHWEAASGWGCGHASGGLAIGGRGPPVVIYNAFNHCMICKIH